MSQNNSLSSLSKMLIFELVQTRRSACSFTSIMSLFDPGPFVKLSFTRKVSFVWLEVLRIVHYCPALLCFAVGFVFTFIFFFCWHGRCTLYPLSRKYLFCVELVFPVTGYWNLIWALWCRQVWFTTKWRKWRQYKLTGAVFNLNIQRQPSTFWWHMSTATG